MQDRFHQAEPVIRPTSLPNVRRLRRNESIPISNGRHRGKTDRSPVAEPSDRSLVEQTRVGDQDAAAHLYHRYCKRLTRLVRKRCSNDLARCAGVEDIVQSVFATFFRRIGEGVYDIPEGQVAWKVLLILALNNVRNHATYHYAAKRDVHRTISGPEARERLQLQGDGQEFTPGHFDLILEEIVDQLSFPSNMIVRLRVDGFTVAEIARIAGCSTRTVERDIRETRVTLGAVFLSWGLTNRLGERGASAPCLLG